MPIVCAKSTINKYAIRGKKSRCRMETVKDIVMETVKKTVYNKQWNK